jgi:serine/threonine-protein kinase
MIGTTISHYQIVEKLGEGGMGVVYKARDLRLDRFVCIKILHPEQVKDESRKQRFIQEAKAASSLNHPNIVTIHEIDWADGTDFMVMEFVAGKTLQQLIPGGGMPVADVLKYAIPIARALAAANAAGIIHRDVKPGNIIVGANGIVKVLDFGLAKLTAPETSAADETQTRTAHTEEGSIVGTAAYMSPEQAQGKPVAARSDIFSFGAMLYEMIGALSRAPTPCPRWPRFSKRSRYRSPNAIPTSRTNSSAWSCAACGRIRSAVSRSWPICASSWKISRRTPIRGN